MPHLVAEQLGLDLVDVTFSGATTANVLTERQRGAPAQIEALDGSEEVVTITIGGNDVGYVPLLMAAVCRARLARRLPRHRANCSTAIGPYQALDGIGDALRAVGTAGAPAGAAGPGDVRRLPDAAAAGRCAGAAAVRCRRRARPARRRHPRTTHGEAAAATGCEVVRAARSRRDHHAWSAAPWTMKPSRFGLSFPGRTVALHPNAAGMRAVADLVSERAGNLNYESDDRVGRPDQGVRPNPCGRRPDLLGRTRHGHRLSRPERRGQDHHHAGDPRAGPPDGGHRHHRRPGLPRAEGSAAQRWCVTGCRAGASRPLGAQPPDRWLAAASRTAA